MIFSIWEKAISILVGNLITAAVDLLCAVAIQVLRHIRKLHPELGKAFETSLYIDVICSMYYVEP